jgi:hypothetical protein
LLAALALGSVSPLVLSCSAPPLGEIVIAIRTDIAIPKDIDRILIDVTVAKTGESKFTMAYQALDPDHTFKLPATLAFTASEKDPGAAVRVRVLALHGADAPRMVREVVTTVPADRTVTLPIPIEFLCDGTAVTVLDPVTQKPVRDKKGDLVFKSTCDEGMTCSAGKCVDFRVPELSLANYRGELVFGGGTGKQDGDCFDAAGCFEGSTFADVDLVNCTIQAGNDVNVALLTQGAGACGASGCFVPLDAESDAGWQPDKNGALRLPPAVCDKIKLHEIGGVVTAPSGKSPCARKQSSLPICGPFSSAGTYVAPSTTAPIVVASGQQNPVALGLEETVGTSRVYWTVRGTFDPASGNPNSDGAVKRSLTTGEEAVVIAKDQASPHDIVVSGSQGVAFWTNASGSAVMTTTLAMPSATALITGTGRPEGVALDGTTLAWTDLTSNQVSQTDLNLGADGATSKDTSKVLAAPDPTDSAPRRIAAVSGLFCWTYEDKLDSTGGVVACNDGSKSIAAAASLHTPRAIAIVPAGVGAGTVYFASFADRKDGGGVYSVASTGGAVTQLSKGHAGFADGEDYPNGLAVDKGVVYWTSRTRGAVMRLSGGTLTEIASHQANPGAIVVGKDAVFWVNEGTVDKFDGAIVRHTK